ncbi:MAG: UDP-N-acetylmuramate--L-alanine ligase [Candidatus Omnitrophica bacterium]|nr:UDP-N-acetylmuramate--L-alanine ligase [Candidatus Omnitrophota bacterium]MCB9784171.1 UDP-N-acetylmuramate--L-alanine ligase [Candidatus Omnitrophota bacterium]
MAVLLSHPDKRMEEIVENRKKITHLPMLEKSLSLHFIGIGGIGMSGLAKVCLEMGCQISGTDNRENDQTHELRRMGAHIRTGIHTDLVEDAGLAVYSTAVPVDHPERLRAEELGVPLIRRGTLLALLAANRKLLGVAGTHGKTTTSSMMALGYRSAGLDPTIVVGGYVPELGGNASLGGDRFLVAETDESDGSFLELDPHLALVTNVEDDHLEHYGDRQRLQEAFLHFISAVENPRYRILCADCPTLMELASNELEGGYVTYGFSEEAHIRGVDIRADSTGSSCRVLRGGDTVGHLHIRVPGRHMLQNALGVYASGLQLGLSIEKLGYGLSEYRGTRRRFEVLGVWNDATLIDDYAHHPTEIRATLQALDQKAEGRRVAVFQPHRYSRLEQLFEEFSACFESVDLLIVSEVYSAGEAPREGINSEALAKKIEGPGQVIYAPGLDEVEVELRGRLQPGDTVLFLGAGNINQVALRLLENKEEA